MHMYCYPLFENGMKMGLRMIALRRKDKELLHKHKTTEKHISYNDN